MRTKGSNYKTQAYKYLYDGGASVTEIAELVGCTPKSVGFCLWTYGFRRPHLGREIELRVADWFRIQGLSVDMMPGDHPFDLKVAGDRVDVKSATISYDKTQDYHSYKFQLQDARERVFMKKYVDVIDYFLLVFKDIDGTPMYRLNSADVEGKLGISVTNPQKTRHPLVFVGNLERAGL